VMQAFLGTPNADQGMEFLPIHLPPGWLLFGAKWTPADPSGFVQRMFTCPCARNVSPSGSVMPSVVTVYGVGESEPPAWASGVHSHTRAMTRAAAVNQDQRRSRRCCSGVR